MPWYLGFDPATRTLAWALVWADLAAAPALARRAAAARQLLRGAAAGALSPPQWAAAGRAVAQLEEATAAAFRIEKTGVVDLGADLDDAARAAAVAAFMRADVFPAARAVGPLTVVVERQMAAVPRDVAAAIAALCAYEQFPVVFIGASLKNQICLGEGTSRLEVGEKYASSYSANKAHAKKCYDILAAEFGAPPLPRALRGHVADCVLEVLAYSRNSSKSASSSLQLASTAAATADGAAGGGGAATGAATTGGATTGAAAATGVAATATAAAPLALAGARFRGAAAGAGVGAAGSAAGAAARARAIATDSSETARQPAASASGESPSQARRRPHAPPVQPAATQALSVSRADAGA